MDILLIDPPYKSLKGIGSEHGYSIGLLNLASYLSANGYEAKVLTGNLLIDLPITQTLTFSVSKYADGQRRYSETLEDDSHYIWEKILNYIKVHKPKVVGITFLTPASELVYKIAQKIKKYDSSITIIVGGHHPTFCPDETILHDSIDFVIRGEGERPLLSLMDELSSPSPDFKKVPSLTYIKNNTIVNNQNAELIEDIDSLPLPERSLVVDCDFNKHKGHYLSTARGCPYACTFCSDRVLWNHKVRRRTVPNVINEIKYLKSNFNLEYIDITDGTFTYDRKYVESFCKALIDSEINIKWRCTARYNTIDEKLLELLKRANCKALYFGLESGSEKILNEYHKKTKIENIINTSKLVYESGIAVITSIMIGLPEETAEDVEGTLNLMQKIKTHIFDINSYVPLPGTVLYEDMDEAQKNNLDWKKIGYKSYMNFFSNHIPQDDLQNYVHKAYEIAEDTLKKFKAKGSWSA